MEITGNYTSKIVFRPLTWIVNSNQKKAMHQVGDRYENG